MGLQEQSLVDIEMPGQYMNGDEPSPDGIVFLEGISANVHVSPATSLMHHILLTQLQRQSAPNTPIEMLQGDATSESSMQCEGI